MNVIICKNKQEVAKEAYKIVKDRINNRKAKVLGLPTGTTPEGLYAEMVKGYKKGEIDFSDVHTFNLDEYTCDSRSISRPKSMNTGVTSS